MFSSLNNYSQLLILSGAFTFLLATLILAKFKGIGKHAALLMYLSSLWTICSGFCLLQSSEQGLLAWVRIEYFSISLFPGFWLLFIFRFLKMRRQSHKTNIALLFLLPFLTLLIVWTNDWHHLFYLNTHIRIKNGLTFLQFAKGPWYTVHMLYFYGSLVTGMLLLHTKLDKNNPLFTKQRRVITFAALIPALANVCYQLGLRPDDGVDLTPIAFTSTTLIMALGLVRFQLFDILPIARERIIESIKEGVIVLDSKARIVFLNASMQKILALSEQNIIGRNVSDFFPLLECKEANQEIEILEHNGQIKTYAVTNSMIEDNHSSHKGKIFLFSDISDQKEAEKKLIEAKELAEQASIAKSDFLSTMSHEIRTPMNAVIGFTHLLSQDARADQEEYLQMLRFSGENLLVLINDILDYNKIEAGKIELEWVDFNLNDLLYNIRGGLIQRANEKGIQIEILLDENLPELISADPVRIGQVLTNLTSNAVKFTETGKVSIAAKLLRSTDAELTIHFEVRDTGIGIARDKQELVFDSFTQASSDTTRKYGGTGLGLAISKKLVQLYGSNIHLESEAGEGSCFSFQINSKRSIAGQGMAKKCRIESNRSLKGTFVLLAEDNDINVLLAKRFLKQWEIDCDVAKNGSIALQMVQEKSYDIVLMDLQMPEMDGYQASAAIRSLPDPQYQTLPIIALTASAMDEVHEKILNAGMNDTVTKPFNPDDLFQKISSRVSTFSST